MEIIEKSEAAKGKGQGLECSCTQAIWQVIKPAANANPRVVTPAKLVMDLHL